MRNLQKKKKIEKVHKFFWKFLISQKGSFGLDIITKRNKLKMIYVRVCFIKYILDSK